MTLKIWQCDQCRNYFKSDSTKKNIVYQRNRFGKLTGKNYWFCDVCMSEYLKFEVKDMQNKLGSDKKHKLLTGQSIKDTVNEFEDYAKNFRDKIRAQGI